MSVVSQNKWYVEPVPDEETDAWLLTYLDLITLLLVLLVVMLALSGQAAKLSPAPATSGLLPAHSGLLPGGSKPDVIQLIPMPQELVQARPANVPTTPAPSTPAIVAPAPVPIDADPLLAMMANTEWDRPKYAPDLTDLGLQQATLLVDLPAHFQADANPDAVLLHVMGLEASVPVSTALTPAATEPALEPEVEEANLLALLELPELGDDIEVIRNKESISFRINSEILYNSAKVDLSREGIAALRKLLPVFKNSDYTITVEGHTDALPIRGGQYPSNWELSSARAGRVVRYLAVNGVATSRLRAIGYADTRALASNNTEQGRTSNRRVEIVLEQPKALSQP